MIASRDATAEIVALSGETMGTSWSVRLAAPAGLDTAPLHAAIQARLDGLVAEMSHWEPGSDLSRFNNAPAGRWTSLPPDLATVIHAGLGIAEASGGAFDPALGSLVDLWGFGAKPVAAPPGAEAIAEARAQSGWHRLSFDPAARRLLQPGGVRLDLSGIAKGYAVDALAELLRRRGFRHCLVEVGGELAGRGVKPDGEPWWVELETPLEGVAPFRVALHEIAVATSGTYVRGDHNLDPATGYPARHGVVSASVLHASAMRADAWASALTVAGPEEGVRMAEREGLAARIVAVGSEGVRERVTAALEAML